MLPGDMWIPTEQHAAELGYITERRTPKGKEAADIVEAVAGVDAIVAALEKYTPEVLAQLKGKIEIITRIGVGYDSINVPAATENGIVIANTPGANSYAVAEMAVALMLAAVRKVCLLDRTVRAGGGWGGPLSVTGQLLGSTVGILGFGNVGKKLAKILYAFDCKVLVYDPYMDKDALASSGAQEAPIDEIITQSDFISLHLPGTAETNGMVNADFLKRMKKTAILINTSRGSVVNEKDLANALKSCEIAAAGLDVFVNEPLEMDSPLRGLGNVVFTPHFSAMTKQAFGLMGSMAIDNIHAHFSGKKPEGLVNPPVYDHMK